MALCYWHQKKPRSYELTFKPSVLSGKQGEEARASCWGGGKERAPPKVPVLPVCELKCFENLEMYMNNSEKNVSVFYKDTKSHRTTEEKKHFCLRDNGWGTRHILKAELTRKFCSVNREPRQSRQIEGMILEVTRSQFAFCDLCC